VVDEASNVAESSATKILAATKIEGGLRGYTFT